MKKRPIISVIIPNYKSNDVLESCLKSISNQTLDKDEFEVFVMDDSANTEDGSYETSKKYGAFWIKGQRERCKNKNLGAELARGDFVYFVDQDMVFTKNVLKEAIQKINKNSLITIPEISFGKGFWTKCKIFERSMYIGNHISQLARIYPKEIFLKSGGFDDAVLGIEDMDLFHRVLEQNPKIKVIEIKSQVYHDEGELKFTQIIRRMRFIGASFNEYKKRYPQVVKRQMSFSKYKNGLPKFLMHPFLTYGFFIMKITEGLSVIIASKKPENQITQY
ncbi:hypothetical protein COU57_06045 [Candidatus Pacearchaeota archaeon CG10_big_fil_rev_8_21_14_0_10_32_14]|nr:MAG: hypothetical protein COU57_06045 [Candidatus Pacearchaeota archaeon CG10_big_fil_rev_8_21_14_0_10_32_14]